MKVSFLGPIMRPEPDVLAELERGKPISSVDELLTHLGYQSDQHRLIRVFSGGRQLGPNESLSGVAEVSLMLTVGGG